MTEQPRESAAEEAPSKKQRNKRLGCLLNLGLIALSLVLGILLCEGILRVLHPMKGNQGKLLEDLPDDPIQYQLIPGAEAVYYGAKVHVNEDGYRGEPLPDATDENVLRLVVLGDSMTFGNGVGERDPYPVRLAQWLSSHAEGWEARAANLGVPSYNTEQVAIQLERKGLTLHPDLVVYGFFVNDAAPKGTAIYWSRPDPGLIQSLSEGSYFLRFLQSQVPQLVTATRKSLGIRARSEGYIEFYREGTESWRNCRDSLERIRNACREADVPLAVVLIPFWVDFKNYPWADCHQAVREELNNLEVPVIDLAKIWGEKGVNGRKYWIDIHQSHPTGEGYQLLTDTVGPFLEREVWPNSPLSTEFPLVGEKKSELDPSGKNDQN
ncbi:MAG: SGNH/GDSL hydrolase family protein [Candidatus Omnitrophica bacterium]|nr:SGNH/GDSL hydrolase family protein [Candidatus Omnitrophota bacterium]MCA9444619.1 SGNH/GDSL hydrolase family protein [Candidatus Omnitrophota bacterium]